MKYHPLIRGLALILLAAAIGCIKHESHPMLGQKAPEATVFTADGQAQTLTDRGASAKVHLIEFWATWCGPCRYSMPMVRDLAKEFKDRGLVVSTVNEGDSPQVVAEYLKGKSIQSDLLLDLDGSAGMAFQVATIPLILLLDDDRIIQASYIGYSNSLYREIHADIETLLAGGKLVARPTA